MERETNGKNYELCVIEGNISAFLSDALIEVIPLNKDKPDFVDKIEKLFDYLRNPIVEKIDKCIDKAWEAFKEIGLKVG